MREPYRNEEEIETIHVYVLRGSESDPPTVDAEPEPGPEQPRQHPPAKPFGVVYCWGIGTFFTLIPLIAIIVANLLPAYDTIFQKTLTLTLSFHPAPGQIQAYHLPAITETRQLTAPATGSSQEPAIKAIGQLIFFNGQFASQVVLAGTTFKGKDGISVVTAQSATIPPATPTTPPTEGTVSVTAYSAIAGTSGNIAAQDINQIYGNAILVQNLNAFSGGKDAQTVTVVTQSDITSAIATGKTTLDQQAHDQAQQEIAPGQHLFPLTCTIGTQANQQAGDQAQSVHITMIEQCIPLAYTEASIDHIAYAFLPHAYKVVSLAIVVLSAEVTTKGTDTLTVHLTVYLQTIHPAIRQR